MTDVNTEDTAATLKQIKMADDHNCDIVRVSCPTKESTSSMTKVMKALSMEEKMHIPIVADVHFDYRRAIEAMKAGVQCVRINPGNIGDLGLKEVVNTAIQTSCAIRIGVNSGSIEPNILGKYGEPTVEAITESAITNCKKMEDWGFENFKISVKSSNVRDSVASYRKLSELVDYPLHLGITEAGSFLPGTVKSAIGIGALLLDGVGDTIRVSLSGDIMDEIKVGRHILRSLGLLQNCVEIISCPTCARNLIDVKSLSDSLEKFCEKINKNIKISILGCVVNGPGEARTSNIGIFGFQKKGLAKIVFNGADVGCVDEKDIMKIVTDLIDTYRVD
jgi:(E)-4-hydroxy-3-methylbut-2-enyl-diphosphate synthase